MARPLQFRDGLCRHLIVIDDDGLHLPACGNGQCGLELGVDGTEFRDGSVDASERALVPHLEDCYDGIAAAHLLGDPLLGRQRVVFLTDPADGAVDLLFPSLQLRFLLLHVQDALLEPFDIRDGSGLLFDL